MTRRTAVVAGGGLAGLAAACQLAESGVRVLLLEKRPFLGGRAYSHQDKSIGVEVDNGQHVFLGCCTEYIAFLKRLGAWEQAHLQKRMRVPVIDKVWGASVLQSAPLPPPLHLLPSLLGFKSLSPAEKLGAIYAFAQIRSVKREKSTQLDDLTFEDWLQKRRQTPNAIRSLWNLIVQPTLNDEMSRVSADLALMVFQEGFLSSRDGANVGWARVGLTSLLGEAARRYIEERGGEVRTGVPVTGIELEDGRVSRVLMDGEALTADAFVLAVPPPAVLPLLPAPVASDPFFARIASIQVSPIVNVHMWYDRPVWQGKFAAFLNTPVQWAFNKTRLWGLEGPGQYIDISLSGAHEFIQMSNAEIVEMFRKEMESLFPCARGASLRHALVVKQRDATFSPRPGVQRLRPAQGTPVGNLYLAGDWTDTGWPATMESAVRSGLMAAGSMLAATTEPAGREVLASV